MICFQWVRLSKKLFYIMEKKYIKPTIKALAIDNEALLAALSAGDKHDEFPDEGEGQFSKENPTWKNSSNSWDSFDSDEEE